MTRVFLLLLVLGAPGLGFAQTPLQPPVLLGTSSGAGGGTGSACNDGVDNDGDGVVDYPGDAGCSSPYDTSESGDNTILLTGSVSGANLNTCIGGTSTGNCVNLQGKAAGTSTVCGSTSGSVCTGTTQRSITGGWTPNRAGVAVNYVSLTGALVAHQSDFRWVHSRLEPAQSSSWERSDRLVIDHSTLDGVIDKTGQWAGQNCFNQQMYLSGQAGVRITNNSIVNFCPVNCAPNDGNCNHGEAFFTQSGTNGIIFDSNYFENNGGTSHLFFTEWPTSSNGSEPRDVCVTRNSFGPRWMGTYNDASIRNGIIVAPTEIYFAPTNTSTSSRVAYQSATGSESQPRACTQCNDGIDNDGDGKIDYWPDGNGDSGCSSASDNSE